MNEKARMQYEEAATKVIQPILANARRLVEAGEIVPAHLWILSLTGETHSVEMDHYMNDDMKPLAAAFIQHLQEQPGVMATIFVSEVWVAEMSSEDFDKKVSAGEDLRPSNNPNRKEGVMIQVESPIGDLTYFAEISRNPDQLGEAELKPKAKDSEGQFAPGKSKRWKMVRELAMKLKETEGDVDLETIMKRFANNTTHQNATMSNYKRKGFKE